jgi:hypothetical protein
VASGETHAKSDKIPGTYAFGTLFTTSNLNTLTYFVICTTPYTTTQEGTKKQKRKEKENDDMSVILRYLKR